MPKIPEGNFKTEQTSRVARQGFVPIQSNSKALRDFGGKARKIGEQIDKADMRAQSLGVAKKSDEDWDKEKERLDGVFGLSDNGVLKKGTDLGNGEVVEEDTRYDKYVGDSTNKWQAKKTAELSGSKNPESLAMHNKYTLGATSDYAERAKVKTHNKVVKGAVTDLQSEGSVVAQNYINGDATEEDLAKFYEKAMDSAELISTDTSNKVIKNMRHSLAMNADNMILSRPDGATAENQAKVQRMISTLPPEMQVVAKSNAKRALDQKEVMNLNKMERDENKLNTTLNSPTALAQASQQVSESLNNIKNSPVSKHETTQGRVRRLVSMQGRISTMTLMSSAVTESDGEVRSLARLSSGDPRVTVAVEEEVDRLARDIASSGMSKFEGFDMETTKNQLRSQINSQIGSIYKEREENRMGFLKKFEPTVARKFASNKPDEAIPQMFSMFKATGGATDDFSLNDIEDIKTDGKTVKQLLEKGDKDGVGYNRLVQQNQGRSGDMAKSAITESASKGGLAPSMIYAVDSSPEFSSRIASAHGNFKANIKSMVANKDLVSSTDGFIKEGSGETKFYNKVKEAMASEDINVRALGFGNNNDARAQGYTDTIAFIAADKFANGEVDSMDDAITETIDEMKENFPMATDGHNMIGVSAQYAKANSIDPSELGDTLKRARKLEVYKDIGYSLDMDELMAGASKNPNLLKKFTAIAGRGGKFEDFADEFGDNIVVVPDPLNSNKIKTYLRDPKTSRLSPIPVLIDGKNRSALSVDVNEYYGNSTSEPSKFGGTQ